MDKNLKKEMILFFAECGVESKKTTEAVEKQLRKLMGHHRYEEYLNITDQVHAETLPIKHTYDCMTTLKEANTLITHQAKIFVDVSAHLYTFIKPLLKSGLTVGDLGCYTGVFINWLASKHSECNFVGFDASIKHVNFAREMNKNPNTKFSVWDYTVPNQIGLEPCDVLVSTFGIDFDSKVKCKYPLDIDNPRKYPSYIAYSKEAYSYFHCWREVIKTEGKLIAVLRIGDIDHLLAVLDAATNAGWGIDLSNSKRIESDDEIFPLLTFTTDNPVQISQEALANWWGKEGKSNGLPDNCYEGWSAKKKYQSLPNKVVIKEKTQTYLDGHTMMNIIGISDDIAYSYSRATTGLIELKTVPVAEAKSLSFKY